MTTERYEQVQTVNDDGNIRSRRVVEYRPDLRQVMVTRVSWLLWLLAGVAGILLTFRFVLQALAADATNGFVNLVYGLTDGLVTPFEGIVTLTPLANGGVVDVAAVIALFIVMLVTAVVVALIRIVFGAPAGRRNVTTVENRD